MSVYLIVPDVMVMMTVGITVMRMTVVSECVCSAACTYIYAKIGNVCNFDILLSVHIIYVRT